MAGEGAYPNTYGRWRQARQYRKQRVGDGALTALEQYLFGEQPAGEQQVALDGSAAGAANAWGALSRTRGIAGMGTAVSTASSGLSTLRGLAGSGEGASVLAGVLLRFRGLSGSAAGQSAAAVGRLGAMVALMGTSLTGMAAQGTLGRWRSLAGEATTLSAAVGELTVGLPSGAMVALAGIASAVSQVVGKLRRRRAWGGKMGIEVHKLERMLGDGELAGLLVTAGLMFPRAIEEASDGDIVEAVGSENLAAVRAAFPARQ